MTPTKRAGGDGRKKVKRFWISWCQPTDDERPLAYPPNESILGWWNSGMTDAAWTLCAVVESPNEAAAKKAVRKDWPEAEEWRFCREVEEDYQPGDRFPLSNWMKRRFRKSVTSNEPSKEGR